MNYKKIFYSLLTIVVLLVSSSSNLQANKNFRTVNKGEATLLQDGKNKAYCQ